MFPLIWETISIFIPIKKGKYMRKDVIKLLIASKQSEIPFDVIERDINITFEPVYL